jgi:hypothetical protein
MSQYFRDISEKHTVVHFFNKSSLFANVVGIQKQTSFSSINITFQKGMLLHSVH